MALQEEMMARARRILADYPDLAEEIEPGIEFAKGHYDVVERFGRYPHRNKALGRESTAEVNPIHTSPLHLTLILEADPSAN
mmetsp:Transcript_22587/g.69954  ORF Transcript_22587/g.69954 Transcript_22587/m.69954 type:complete len:82 (-) Transcript_22587:51-296(-)